MVAWKKLLIAYFYNTIKSMTKQIIGGFGFLATIPDDAFMALIGYLIHAKTNYKDEGEALMISAVSSLGATTGLAIFTGLFGGGQTQTQATAQAVTPYAYEVIR